MSKNYLTPSELSELNLLTTRFLDFAEDRARRRQQITMGEWVMHADRLITFDERSLLTDAGAVSANSAERIAREAYDFFDSRRRETESAAALEEEAADISRLAALESKSHSPD